jgi:hypothetical protein
MQASIPDPPFCFHGAATAKRLRSEEGKISLGKKGAAHGRRREFMLEGMGRNRDEVAYPLYEKCNDCGSVKEHHEKVWWLAPSEPHTVG